MGKGNSSNHKWLILSQVPKGLPIFVCFFLLRDMFNGFQTVVFNCFFFLARLFYFELDVRCEGQEGEEEEHEVDDQESGLFSKKD